MQQNSEKLCLKWNDFQENVASAFGQLRSNNEFSDVTLACDDGEQVKAHKVILASSSPFFMELLTKNKHPHPLIYMRGLKSEVLLAILDFLYFGEANLWQEKLDDFLALAMELRLKGLEGNDAKENEGNFSKPQSSQMKSHQETPSQAKPDIKRSIQAYSDSYRYPNTEVEIANQTPSGEMQELDDQIKSMISNSEISLRSAGISGSGTVHTCNVCGKRGENSNIKRHIEANHITGFTHACDTCGHSTRSRHALSDHKRNSHKRLIAET